MSLLEVGGMSSGEKGVSDYSGLLPILLPPPPLSCISLFFLQNFSTMVTLTALLHMDRNTHNDYCDKYWYLLYMNNTIKKDVIRV